MNLVFNSVMAAAAVLGVAVVPALADDPETGRASPADFAPRPTIIVPHSSIDVPADRGVRAHTHYRYIATDLAADMGPPISGYQYQTPASLACIYGVVVVADSCNPNKVTTNSAKGSKVIVIVDAYDDPNARADLTKFSAQFGLPAPTAASFQVVYASGSEPVTDPSFGWEGEEALDIEMTHAMAPKAKIILVEAASSAFTDLEVAVKRATALVVAAGGGEVSMSYGGSEFAAQTAYDPDYTGKNVVYLASSGDSPGVSWPSTSPNVVAVGGTTIRSNPATGAFINEIAWEDTGGGLSTLEKIPAYQAPIKAFAGTHRAVPDVAAIGDPSTGVWVYFSNETPSTPWYVYGGTSVAVQVWAGILNAAGKFEPSTAAEESLIYAASSTNFRDVAAGFCGPWAFYPAHADWDFCTGEGSSNSLLGK